MSVSTLLAAGYEVGHGRLVPSLAAFAGLASVVLGARAKSRALAVTALAAGLTSAAVGAVHGANAAGGLGTGNGLAGAVIAVALGLVGAGLGGLSLARTRRAAR